MPHLPSHTLSPLPEIVLAAPQQLRIHTVVDRLLLAAAATKPAAATAAAGAQAATA